jgi:2-C-methyl-D-erythritol 4-phosphate cytidylyltransferase
LHAVPDAAEIVVVHDAARPLASATLFGRVVEAVRAGADAAVPALAVSDTIKRVEGDVVVETLDRAVLVGVQTPQAFRASVLREAHASGAEATDDAAVVEAIGGKVVTVEGERRNVKLTTPEDLLVARALLGAGR